MGWPSPKECENIGQLSQGYLPFSSSGRKQKVFFSIFQVLMQSRVPMKTSYLRKEVSYFLVSTLSWPSLQETEHRALETSCVSVKHWKQRRSRCLKSVRHLVLLWMKASLSVLREQQKNLSILTLAMTLTWQEVPDNLNALGNITIYFDSAPELGLQRTGSARWSPAHCRPPRGITETAPAQLSS